MYVPAGVHCPGDIGGRIVVDHVDIDSSGNAPNANSKSAFDGKEGQVVGGYHVNVLFITGPAVISVNHDAAIDVSPGI